MKWIRCWDSWQDKTDILPTNSDGDLLFQKGDDLGSFVPSEILDTSSEMDTFDFLFILYKIHCSYQKETKESFTNVTYYRSAAERTK